MTTENDKQFKIEDRKIEGHKYQEDVAVDQKSAAEFLAALDTVLGIAGVKKVRWTQYTPYFNDGDPCEFSLNEFTVKLGKKFGVGKEEGEHEDGYLSTYDFQDHTEPYPTIHVPYLRHGETPSTEYLAAKEEYERQYKAYKDSATYVRNGHDTKAIFDALEALNALSASFEVVAKANFGDHAEVTATLDGFNVDEYSHD